MSRMTTSAREQTNVATTQPVVKFTYEDYETTPEDQRYELLDGDLIMVPAPNVKHQVVLGNLHYHLRLFVTEHDIGLLLLAPCDVVLSDTDVVQPDLLFVSRERENPQVNEIRLTALRRPQLPRLHAKKSRNLRVHAPCLLLDPPEHPWAVQRPRGPQRR